MKYIIIIIYLLSFFANAQAVQTDPKLIAKIVNNGNIESTSNLAKENRQAELRRKSEKIATQLTAIQLMHKKNLEVKQNASSLIRQSKMFPYVVNMGRDALEYQKSAIDYVSNDPKLILLSLKSQSEVLKKSIDIGIDLRNASKGGLDNLLSQTERRIIINRTVQDMRILRGLSYGLMRKIKAGADGNFIKTLLNEYNIINFSKTIDRAKIVRESLPFVQARSAPKSSILSTGLSSSNFSVDGNNLLGVNSNNIINNAPIAISESNFAELETVVRQLTNNSATIINFDEDNSILVDTDNDGISDNVFSFNDVAFSTSLLSSINIDDNNFNNINDFRNGINNDIIKFLADSNNVQVISFNDDNTEILISTDDNESTIEKRISKELFNNTLSNAIKYSSFLSNHNLDLDIFNHYLNEIKSLYNTDDFTIISVNENYLFIDRDNDNIFDDRIAKSDLALPPLKEADGIYYTELSSNLDIDKDIIENYLIHLENLYPNSYFKIVDVDSSNIYIATDSFNNEIIALDKSTFPIPKIFNIDSNHYSNLSVSSGLNLEELSDIKIQLDNFYNDSFYRIKKIENNKVFIDTNQIGDYDVVITIN